jgi:hypothetical protein
VLGAWYGLPWVDTELPILHFLRAHTFPDTSNSDHCRANNAGAVVARGLAMPLHQAAAQVSR